MDDRTQTVEAGSTRGGREDAAFHARLIILNPPELATEIPIGGARVIIGRAPAEPTHRLTHPTISREHLAIELRAEGKIVVEDLESRNGVHVDGARITHTATARAGSVIRFGDVVAIYETSGAEDAPSYAELPGRSAAMARLRADLDRAARGTASALITGQTGTGKERVARAIHRASGRTGAFVAVNCAELSPELLAGALFGHERGAFTSAEAARPGLVRSAEGGTLLLDEIGELAIDVQAKLLRMLEEREVLPLGGSRPIAVDVRFLASTHRDLLRAVEAGTFRRDLYARLALHELVVPPLAERRADLLDWLHLFYALDVDDQGPDRPLTLDGSGAEWILRRDYAGNLRDLRAIALRARSAAKERWSASALERLVSPTAQARSAADEASAEPRSPVPTKAELEQALATHKSVRAVAKALGRDRRQIYRWLEAWGLKRP